MASIITKKEREYLLDSMKSLLKEYGYDYREAALNKIIDKWSTEKASLINAFKKHLKGKFMIAFDVDYERTIDKKEIKNFSRWLLNGPVEKYCDAIPSEVKDRKSYWDSYLPSPLYCFIDDLACYADKVISEDTVSLLKTIIPEVRVSAGQNTSRVINKIIIRVGRLVGRGKTRS